jgi:hypothetical protein
LTLLALAVTAAACSSDDGTSEDAEESAPTTVPSAARVESLALDDVELGGQPRVSLLLDQTTVQVWHGDLAFSIAIGPAQATATGPSELTVNRSSGDGAVATGTVGPLDLSLDADPPTNVDDALTYDLGFTVSANRLATEPTSAVTQSPELDTDIIGDIDPSLAWFVFPVPEEPVGPGATWRLVGTITLFGATFDVEVQVEVASITARAYALDLTLDLELPSEEEPIALSGRGRVSGAPDQVAPNRATISVSGGDRVLNLVVRRTAAPAA